MTAIVLLALVAASGPADQPRGLAGLRSNVGLVPSRAVERALMLKAAAEEAENALKTVAGVADAHVQLPITLPGQSTPAAPARASVVLALTDPVALSDGAARQLVAASIDGLAESDVDVVMSIEPQAASGAERVVNFGPFRVAETSRKGLLTMMLMLCALTATTSAMLLVRYTRRRRWS